MAMGLIVLVIAGVFQGSFGLGYKKYTPFSWAAFWGIYDIMCIITSIVFTFILAPKFISVFANQSISFFISPLICGGMWGLSAIGFSKGIDKIGMSLVYGISMGISTIIGSLVPMIMNDNFPQGTSSIIFWLGLTLTLAGVIIITIAGVKRDGVAKNSVFGIGLAVFSGIGSGFMNVGFTNMSNITTILESYGYSQLAISATKWLPVLVGGCLSGLLYCIGEVTAKKDCKTLTAKGSISRSIKLFGVSIIWYLALILYGYSVFLLGNLGETVGWILFNALALIISTCWGLKTGEWKNTKKTLLFSGCIIMIVAWFIIALV